MESSENKREGKEESLLQAILEEARQQSRAGVDERKTLVVLGAQGTGKSSLVEQLRADTEGGDKDGAIPAGLSLTYSYIDIRDEQDETIARIGTWEFPAEEQHRAFWPYALSSTTIRDGTVALLIFDSSRPYSAYASVTHLLDGVRRYCRESFASAEFEKSSSFAKNIWRHHMYLRQQQKEGKGEDYLDDAELPPLPEGVMTDPVGLPVILVGCKSDLINANRYGADFEHDDKLLQLKLRTLGLRIGAPVIFTSARKERNIEPVVALLGNYFSKLPALLDPELVDKDKLVIPPGWDSNEQIQQEFAGMDVAEEFRMTEEKAQVVTVTPAREKRTLLAETDEEFLERHWSRIKDQVGGGGGDGESELFTDILDPKAAPVVQEAAKAVPGSGEAQGAGATSSAAVSSDEREMLKSFFDNLVSTKSTK
mmetsp:Transcript_1327/g.3534  ORF Transcript_1327/g.3534 Transcript_1327/m.3534 type:complete len:425 (+) Transcript_1327:96-1370(+)